MVRRGHIIGGVALIVLAAALLALLGLLADPDEPTALADEGALPSGCERHDDPAIVTCTYTSSDVIYMGQLVDGVNKAHVGDPIDPKTPVWVQAWGGAGGHGSGGKQRGDSGTAGYALTVSTAGELQDPPLLQVYVGQSGSNRNGGQGGSSSAVSNWGISKPGSIFVVAGGGGGGSSSCGSVKGADGGAGGVAIAGGSAASAAGASGHGERQGGGGNANGSGSGGSGGGASGSSGFGGYGGSASTLSPVSWRAVNTVDPSAQNWSSGRGGNSAGVGGAGGGGYGGGGAGARSNGDCPSSGRAGSGGGGGSYAIASTTQSSHAPTGRIAGAAQASFTFELDP